MSKFNPPSGRTHSIIRGIPLTKEQIEFLTWVRGLDTLNKGYQDVVIIVLTHGWYMKRDKTRLNKIREHYLQRYKDRTKL
jgi:hypothetical protein